MNLLDRISTRQALALVVAFVIAAMATALYFQFGLGLKPCPLCSLQRMALILAALVALAGVLFARSRAALWATLAATGVATLAGTGIAIWHVWILAYPPEAMSCGRPFEWFSEDFPLIVWLPRLFRGDGDCLSTEFSLLGLNIPHLALLGFGVVLALLAIGVRAMRRRVAA